MFSVSHALEWLLVGLAVVVAFLGWFAAHWRYRSYRPPLENKLSCFLLNGWYADRVVDLIIVRPFSAMAQFCSNGCDRSLFDGIVDGLGKMFARCASLLTTLATGRPTTYLSAFAWGFLVLLGWFLLTLVNGGGH